MTTILPPVVVTADPLLTQLFARDRKTNAEENIRTALDAFKTSIWTSLPCIVVSYNAAENTVSAQPAIRGILQNQNGERTTVDMPLLVDVPVVFQGGGGTWFTSPVKAGDECLVVFSARDIDAWWASSGVQNPMSRRLLDLSDGFAFIGPMSRPTVISGISTTAAELRNASGTAKITLNPTTRAVTIVSPGGSSIDGDLHITGNLLVDGSSSSSGAIGTGDGAAAATYFAELMSS